MTAKNIQERSRVLRIALDQGVLNLKELRSFLVSVEVEAPPVARGVRKMEIREHHRNLLLKNKKAASGTN